MDDLALASTMKRLAIWLDQTRQPVGRPPDGHRCARRVRGLGYLTTAVTAEGDRGRGAHSALIAARIVKARELGCTALAVDTLTILERSLRNLERAGFRVVYEKEVYEWSVEPSG